MVAVAIDNLFPASAGATEQLRRLQAMQQETQA